MDNLQNEVRERLKKSDALIFFKEISQQMTKEEFVEFSNTAMKSAYDKNRVKAVDYMLSFYEYNQPPLLLRIHLQLMLSDSKKMESGKKMLQVLLKNFSEQLCYNIMDDFLIYHKRKNEYLERYAEINKIILEEKMPNNQISHKTIKI